MHIIGGIHKRQTLYCPKGVSLRPTRHQVRQAVFNILRYSPRFGHCIEGALVLDICCGSGAYGLEALSQGAAWCIFLDQSRFMLDCTYRNAQKLGESRRSTFLCVDARNLPSAPWENTLVFLDPPYTTPHLTQMITAIGTQGWIADYGVLVVETSKKKVFSWPDTYSLVDLSYLWRDTAFFFKIFIIL